MTNTSTVVVVVVVVLVVVVARNSLECSDDQEHDPVKWTRCETKQHLIQYLNTNKQNDRVKSYQKHVKSSKTVGMVPVIQSSNYDSQGDSQ